MDIWKWFQEFFKPQNDWPLQTLEQFRRQRQIQALWIGILAFLLPLALYYGHRTADCFRDSISHSYYLPFWGDVFVATTCSVGLFLMFYRGQSRPERYLAIFGGVCAIMVAMNPTNGSGCDVMFAQSRILFETHSDPLLIKAFPIDTFRGKFHLWSAVALFIVLAIFNLFVFTATDERETFRVSKDNPNKKRRNVIYIVCGVLMIITLVSLTIGLSSLGGMKCDAFQHNKKGIFAIFDDCPPGFWDRNNLTFYFEWLGLAVFGIAWFVKGRGGGFLLTDENSTKWFSKPWWWKLT